MVQVGLAGTIHNEVTTSHIRTNSKKANNQPTNCQNRNQSENNLIPIKNRTIAAKITNKKFTKHLLTLVSF